jgi:hypothetical protein
MQTMALENLSLPTRLLVALVPGLVLVPVIISLYYCPACLVSDMGSFLVYFLLWAYFALFGACVLAPLLPADCFSGKRVVALMLGTSLLIFPFLFLAVQGSSLMSGSTLVALLGMSLPFIVTTLLMGVLLHFMANMRLGAALVIHLALSGFAAGLMMGFFIDQFLCVIFCDDRENLLLLIPLIVWPALVAAAVHLAKRAQPELRGQ